MYQSLSFFVAGLALVHGLAVPEPEMLDLSERTNGPITVAANPKTAGATACSNLAKVFKDETFMPGTANYTIEASDNIWASNSLLSPVCVFSPKDRAQLSRGLAIVKAARSLFSVRSGGHMPAPGAQSNSVGPLFAMTNFNCLKLSKNGTVAQIGTGNRWKAVYEWIEPYGLAINGGRYAQVGVGGLLLGGGINNFGNSHGWSVNSVVNFEVVLASGKLASVNAKSYPDLFWALKGGSSNFAIVTRFDMKTIPIHGAITGISQWFGPSVPLVLDALASFIAPGGGIDDPKTQINPSVAVIPKNGSVSSLNIAFVKDNTTIPTALENFTAVTPFATSLGPRPSWASGALELAGYNVQHEREIFMSVGLIADPKIVQFAYDIVIPSANEHLKDIEGSTASIAYQPISHAWLQAARNSGGDAIDLDPAKGSFVVTLIAYHWADPADDEFMVEWGREVIANLTTAAKAQNLYYPFIYLNDAYNGQQPFPFYGEGKSLPKLNAAAQKYDPQGVFKNLLTGVFKLDGSIVASL